MDAKQSFINKILVNSWIMNYILEKGIIVLIIIVMSSQGDSPTMCSEMVDAKVL